MVAELYRCLQFAPIYLLSLLTIHHTIDANVDISSEADVSSNTMTLLLFQ